ncbi:hypothetical protein EOL70_26380 [Leucothrix sargassi]|nr:hypothetical protein EOL70_26380 [Leucothrix sargassi]
MSTKKQAAGLSALKNLKSTTSTEEELKETKPKKAPTRRAASSKSKAPASKARIKSAAPSPTSKVKKEKTAFSLFLPEEAHEKLRELAFHERDSMTQLILEGVDLLFESRGLPAIAKPPLKDK